MPGSDGLSPNCAHCARIAAHSSWAVTDDRAARTAPARQALLARFEKQVDPSGTLPVEERLKRVESARKAYYSALAYKSAKARSRRTS